MRFFRDDNGAIFAFDPEIDSFWHAGLTEISNEDASALLTPPPTADNHRAAVAARRYEQETAGIVWQGHGIATDRESQQKLSDERNAVKDNLRTDGKGWKCLDLTSGVTVFRPTSNAEMLELSAAAYRHVSDCFDREAELLEAIAAGTYSPAMLEEGWP
jgi:hypothetical protein